MPTDASGSRVAMPLSRSGLVVDEVVWLLCLGLWFGWPFIVIWLLKPSMWLTWLLCLLGAVVVAGLIHETPSAIVTLTSGRSPLVMDASGISVRSMRPIPWDAVEGVHVGDSEVTVQLSPQELRNRGLGPDGLANDRIVYKVSLDWIDAEPAAINEALERARAYARAAAAAPGAAQAPTGSS